MTCAISHSAYAFVCYHKLVDAESKSILTVNAGSSSIKMALFNETSLECTVELSVTGIGSPSVTLEIEGWGLEQTSQPIHALNHSEAIAVALDCVDRQFSAQNIAAIGHRIVHGGQSFNNSIRFTPAVVDELKSMSAFDPEHLPLALDLVEEFNRRFPSVTQIACFDTSFYRDLPDVARLLPLPRRLESLGLRRYGFHGLSYESLLKQFGELAGKSAANGKIILAHLGSGASLTAVKDGKVVDTTMSFTPASGVPMSTRSGDLDPGIADFLCRQTGMTGEEFNHMIHFESGLLGVSGLSADMKLLLEQSEVNPKAADAVHLFCYQVRKAIGSLTTTLGGLDSLIFSGGIGEKSSAVRTMITQNLGFLGIELDEKRNQAHEFLISSEQSQVGVHVIHTDEASVIASEVKKIMDAEQ